MPINPQTIRWDDPVRPDLVTRPPAADLKLVPDQVKWDRPEPPDPLKPTVQKMQVHDIPHVPSVPFNIDGFVEDEGKNLPLDQEVKKDFSDVMYPIFRPFLATGAVTAKAINEGLGVFATHLDVIAEYVEKKGKELGLTIPAGGIFEEAAKIYEENAEYWKKKADKVGITFIDELLGEAMGGAPAGVGEFILNIPYFTLLGAAEASKEGKSEIAGALVEGGKRGVLGLIFKAIHPLKQYLRAPTMGTVFGVQAMAEGGDYRGAAKAFGAGVLYSMLSPGGRMGLNEVKDGIKSEMAFLKDRAKAIELFAKKPIPEVGKAVKGEPGAAEAEPDTYAIHYGKERYETVEPTPKGREVSIFSKEVQARMDASTKMTDYVPLSQAYEPGARVEQGLLGKQPHVVKVSGERIYDAKTDPEGFWDKARARVEKDPEIQAPTQAHINNAFAAELKASGKYDGFTVTHGKDKWFSFFDPQKVVDPSVKTKVRFSTMVGAVETAGPGLEAATKTAQEKRVETEKQIRELKKSYPELKISTVTPTAARFTEATEGVMEHGGTVTVDGPLAAVRSFYSEMGLKNDQYAIMIDRPLKVSGPSMETGKLKGSVVTKTGKPWEKVGDELEVYHGSPKTDIDTFSGKEYPGGIKSPAIYFTPNESLAKGYTGGTGEKGGRVYKVKLSIKNPIEKKGRFIVEELIEAHKQGYDGAISRDADGTIIEYAAFSPAQIISAFDKSMLPSTSGNASKIRFRVHKSKTKQDVEDAFRKQGLEDFNVEEPSPGNMVVDMVVGDYLKPAEQLRMRDALIKIADEVGAKGMFEDVRITSEVIGSFEDIAPPAKGKVVVAPGSDTTPISQTYPEGAKTKGNVWVRQSKAKSNKKRVLLVQISSKAGAGKTTEAAGGNKYAAIGDQFFDKLYERREGYERPEDFWEIPVWIGNAARNFKKSDVYVVRDIEAARRFLNEAGYGKVMFSAMDEHIPAIKGTLKGYEGDVLIGGYVDKGTFKEFGNVKFFDSMAAAANEMGVKFKEGVDYRHFKGAKTIPRLCMSKGCKHNCAFCVVQKDLEVTGKKTIAEELESFKDLDYELVYLNDKTFGQAENYKDLVKINKGLKKQNPNFKGFIVQTTAPQMAKFTDEFLRDSGIKYVELGVESYNDSILKKVNKPAREKNIDEAVEVLRKHDIQFIPNVMVGLGGKGWSETAETYKRTLDFLKKNEDIISHVNLYNLAVYKGTKISEQLAEEAGVDQNVIKPSADKIHEKFYKDVIDLGIKVLDKGPQKTIEYDVPKITEAQKDYKKNILAYWGTKRGEERYDEALREGQGRTLGLAGKAVPVKTKEEKVERPEIATMIEPPKNKEDLKEPLFTEAQMKRRAKAKAVKMAQMNIKDAREASEGVHEMIRQRRYNLNLAAYETNFFVNDIEKATTRAEREVIPFIIEGTGVPPSLKRKDLEDALAKDDGKLTRIAKQVREHFDKGWVKIKENTPDMTAEQIEDYVTHIWDIPKAKKQEVTSWFTTQNRFLKKRYIETLEEGIEKFGLKPKVLDIGEIIRIHDGVTSRVIENNNFVKSLKELKYDGAPLIARADKAPEDWAFMDHPALRRGLGIPMKDKKTGEAKGIQVVKLPVKVHPDLKKPLEVIFSSKFDHEVIRAYEMVAGVLKKTTLSLSLFHHGALGETGAATMSPLKVLNIAFNPAKIYKALVKKEFEVFKNAPLARDAIIHGLQLGATADIPVNRIQRGLDSAARKTKNVPIINKTTAFIRTFNETWDKALWDYYHDTLKLYGYEALTAKIDPAKDITKQKREIAQFVNDTFGGQNWDTLMVSPKSLQIMSWSLLSPDWTLSTVRQALSPTGIGAVYKESKGLRQKMGAHFWIKAAIYFGAGINMLNYTFRKKDEEDNPQYYEGMGERTFMDRTMVGNTFGHKTHLFAGRYEDGTERYIRWGKQFRELPELFFDDTGFSPISATLKKVGGKMNPLLQLGSQIMTGSSLSGFKNDDVSGKKGWDKVLGIGKTIMKAPLPFSTRTLWTDNKEFHFTDLMMPSSKGMTRYKSMELFKYAIVKQDEQYLKEVYQFTLMNNLPAYTLFKAGLTSLKAESTREYNEGIETLNDAIEKLEETENIADLNRVQRTIARLQKEQTDRQVGMDLLDQAILEMQINEILEGD